MNIRVEESEQKYDKIRQILHYQKDINFMCMFFLLLCVYFDNIRRQCLCIFLSMCFRFFALVCVQKREPSAIFEQDDDVRLSRSDSFILQSFLDQRSSFKQSDENQKLHHPDEGISTQCARKDTECRASNTI